MPRSIINIRLLNSIMWILANENIKTGVAVIWEHILASVKAMLKFAPHYSSSLCYKYLLLIGCINSPWCCFILRLVWATAPSKNTMGRVYKLLLMKLNVVNGEMHAFVVCIIEFLMVFFVNSSDKENIFNYHMYQFTGLNHSKHHTYLFRLIKEFQKSWKGQHQMVNKASSWLLNGCGTWYASGVRNVISW